MSHTESRKPSVKVNAILVTGITGCGKTVLLDSLKAFLDPHSRKDWIMRSEMSDIIRWGRDLPTDLGDEVRRNESLMGKGKFMPDSIINPLFSEWLKVHTPQAGVDSVLMLVSGCPRTTEQLKLLELFDCYAVVHLVASEEHARTAVLRRQRELGRADDAGGEEVFQRKLHEYKNQVLPALDALRNAGENILELKREHPLETRMEYLFRYLLSMSHSPVSRNMAKRANRRLRIENHPAHHMVKRILSPQPSMALGALVTA